MSRVLTRLCHFVTRRSSATWKALLICRNRDKVQLDGLFWEMEQRPSNSQARRFCCEDAPLPSSALSTCWGTAALLGGWQVNADQRPPGVA